MPNSHAMESRASGLRTPALRTLGFTLVELMITLSVLAILVGLATPSFRDFTRSNQVTAANNDLVTALNLARSEALRRSTGVTVCPSTDGAVCGAAADWKSGWIVFEDAAGTGVVASADKVVQKWGSINGNIQIATASANIQYQSTGTVAAAAGLDVSYTSCTGPRKRHLQVSAAGTISTQIQTCS